jgi:hypothetical protein
LDNRERWPRSTPRPQEIEMSKHNNVNPGQYKVAGRERPGEDVPEPERSPGTRGDTDAETRWERKQKEKHGSSDLPKTK